MPTIEWRRRAGRGTGILLALVFAGLLVPVATAEIWLGFADHVREGEPSPITVRIPAPASPELFEVPGRILVARGQTPTADEASAFRRLFLDGRGDGGRAALGLFVSFALIGIMLLAHLRTTQRGRILRVQLTVLASFLLLAAAFKAYLLFTPLSVFLVPAAALALLVGLVIDRNIGLGAAIALGLLLSQMTPPYDATVAVVFAAQGVGAVLAFTRAKKRRSFLVSGAVAAATAAATYVAITFLLEQRLPFGELAHLSESPLLATVLGGFLAGPLALLLRPPVEALLGEIPKSRLQELADLENPLLKQIAQKAPGTWQHSLAMANLAEGAASAIGANALLVRVGAYYHDLGKSLSPGHYIENMDPKLPSPHDAMAPEESAAAIFAHVTEGVRVGREKGLPEAVIDFMHMHHGDGVLEYFWGKCLEAGNPKKLAVRSFRYPGAKPQTRETAILAICDAVEAASRSLRQPDARAIDALVQRIVYGKLHLGQLDESGLTVAELKAVADVLVDTLKHAHHIRVEYPWQKEDAKMAAAAQPTPEAALATRQHADTTQRVLVHALDSADLPRPYWNEGNGGKAASKLDVQPTRTLPRPSTERKLPPPPPPPAPPVPVKEEMIEDLEPDPNTPQPWSLAEVKAKDAEPTRPDPVPEPETIDLEPDADQGELAAAEPVVEAKADPPPEPQRDPEPEPQPGPEPQREPEPTPEPMTVQPEPQPEPQAAESSSPIAEAAADFVTPDPEAVTPSPDPKPLGRVKLKRKRGNSNAGANSTTPATPGSRRRKTPKPIPIQKVDETPVPEPEPAPPPIAAEAPEPEPEPIPVEAPPEPEAAPVELEPVAVITPAGGGEVDESAITTPMRAVREVAPSEPLPDNVILLDQRKPAIAFDDRPMTDPNMVAEGELLPPQTAESPDIMETLAADELSADELEEIDPIEDVEEDSEKEPTAVRPYRMMGPPPSTRGEFDEDESSEPTRVAALGEEEREEQQKLLRSTLPPRGTPPPRRRMPPPPPEGKKRAEDGEE